MMRSVLLRMSTSQWCERQVKRRRFAQKAVRKFMPGESVNDALEAAQRLGRRGIGVVLTELGENVATESEATAVACRYEQVVDRLAALALDGEISVKPTHLGLDVNEGVAAANLRRLARKAGQAGSTVWVDMEDSSTVDATLSLVGEARQVAEPVGVCLQAYLHRTPEDLARLMADRVRVRLVKGAYREEPEHAIARKKDVDQRYHELAVEILRDRAYVDAATPVFGTHDARLIERVRESARQYGASPGQLEFHMLYGIQVPTQEWLAAVGARVRVLISYGDHWYPWYMRRLAERPANLWFVLRKAFA
ncbi:MAG TPA: proline dehydrogenase family protein [Longimicrobiales bacterium]|nr:proline dehydrogenase family protein [Longimicrobiales bacterium]